jgi:hypothetical protein
MSPFEDGLAAKFRLGNYDLELLAIAHIGGCAARVPVGLNWRAK